MCISGAADCTTQFKTEQKYLLEIELPAHAADALWVDGTGRSYFSAEGKTLLVLLSNAAVETPVYYIKVTPHKPQGTS